MTARPLWGFSLKSDVLQLGAKRYLREASDLFVMEGQFEQALTVLEACLQDYPDHVAALTLRGDVLFCLGEEVEAVRSLDKALELKPNHAEALLSKAGVLETIGQPRKALEMNLQAEEALLPQQSYLMPVLLEQRLGLLLETKKVYQARWELNQAINKLDDAEYSKLNQVFRAKIETACTQRLETRARLKTMNLRAI